MAELIVIHRDGATSRHALGLRALILGRDASCDIPLSDPGSSRRHARVTCVPEGYLVEDLGSKNGTLVNDAPCSSRLLRNGDRVLVGSTRVEFCTGDDEQTCSVSLCDETASAHSTRFASSDRELNLSRQRLKLIYELTERLTRLQGHQALLDAAMGVCFETLRFERGAIGVRRRGSRQVDWPVVRGLRGAQGELTISRTLLSRALELGERAIFTEGEAGMVDPTVSMVQHGVRSAMCVPLSHGDETLGVIYGDRVGSSVSYTTEDIDFLAGIARQVSIGLVNCHLLDEQQRMARLQHDVEVARRIQQGLFPADLPNRKGLNIAALNDPGRRVSGDYYDVIEMPDGRVWMLMADVAGEGMPAALLMASLQATVRATITGATDPGTLLTSWNQLVCRSTDPSRFITCLLGLLDPSGGEMVFASAGHFPPLVVRGLEWAPTEPEINGDLPLGIDRDASYASTRVVVDERPFMVLSYTDGVTEAPNADGQLFGRDRLLEVAAQSSDLNPATLIKDIRRQVASFGGMVGQADDVTLLAARLG